MHINTTREGFVVVVIMLVVHQFAQSADWHAIYGSSVCTMHCIKSQTAWNIHIYIYIYNYISLYICILSLLNSWWFRLETVVFGIRIYTLSYKYPTDSHTQYKQFCQLLVISVITDGMAISNTVLLYIRL